MKEKPDILVEEHGGFLINIEEEGPGHQWEIAPGLGEVILRGYSFDGKQKALNVARSELNKHALEAMGSLIEHFLGKDLSLKNSEPNVTHGSFTIALDANAEGGHDWEVLFNGAKHIYGKWTPQDADGAMLIASKWLFLRLSKTSNEIAGSLFSRSVKL